MMLSLPWDAFGMLKANLAYARVDHEDSRANSLRDRECEVCARRPYRRQTPAAHVDDI
jgi:hypothetical protein